MIGSFWNINLSPKKTVFYAIINCRPLNYTDELGNYLLSLQYKGEPPQTIYGFVEEIGQGFISKGIEPLRTTLGQDTIIFHIQTINLDVWYILSLIPVLGRSPSSINYFSGTGKKYNRRDWLFQDSSVTILPIMSAEEFAEYAGLAADLMRLGMYVPRALSSILAYNMNQRGEFGRYFLNMLDTRGVLGYESGDTVRAISNGERYMLYMNGTYFSFWSSP